MQAVSTAVVEVVQCTVILQRAVRVPPVLF
jgi:hypothetical protein